jgi:hypothetical protein
MVWYDAEKGRPMKEHQEAQGDMPGAGVVDLSYTRWKRFETIEIPMKITMEPAGAGRALLCHSTTLPLSHFYNSSPSHARNMPGGSDSCVA